MFVESYHALSSSLTARRSRIKCSSEDLLPAGSGSGSLSLPMPRVAGDMSALIAWSAPDVSPVDYYEIDAVADAFEDIFDDGFALSASTTVPGTTTSRRTRSRAAS